jgi:hypothetical protein
LAFKDDGLRFEANQLHFDPNTLANLQISDECGFLPAVGVGGEYSQYGCLNNSYDVNDRHGKERILFVGDSATHRGRIVKALRAAYGEDRYEYWNAGVESFNTAQEAVFYRRYNQNIHPDQVIVTFHNNDFMATPIAFHQGSELLIYSPRYKKQLANAWLFKNSFVYRWIQKRTLEIISQDEQAQEVRKRLQELKGMTDDAGIRLTVVVLPIFQPYDKWRADEQWSRKQSLEILDELKIRHFDLLPSMEAAMRDKVEIQESPSDTWHPSDEVAQYFARFLAQEGLLEKKK